MFGYVTIDKPELKFKDFDTYKAFYCGLCRSLKESYGLKGELTLNYDLTFLGILLSGLYEPETKISECRCLIHPFEKHTVISNDLVKYAADMNLLLTYYKCLDDKNDDGSFKGRVFSAVLSQSVQNIILKYPEKAKTIEDSLKDISDYEKSGLKDLDTVSGMFGKLMSAIFVYKQDEWSEYLSKTGFFLGKYLYILDAYLDIDEDRKKGHYNPLIGRFEDEEQCKKLLTMMITECTQAYDMLPIVKYSDILDNILYAGIWSAFRLKSDTERKKDKQK